MRVIFAPLVQAIALACFAWLTARTLPQFDLVLPLRVPVSVILVAAGVVVLLLAVKAFVVRGTTIDPLHPERAEKLVTTGLFRFSRNPMYLGMLLVLLGVSLFAPIVFVISINVLQIVPEEAALRQKFGQEYEAYCQRTRRWI